MLLPFPMFTLVSRRISENCRENCGLLQLCLEEPEEGGWARHSGFCQEVEGGMLCVWGAVEMVGTMSFCFRL